MSIENIVAISSVSQITSVQPQAATQSPDFGQWLVDNVQNLNEQSSLASKAVEQVLAGDIQNLHQVIMQVEKAEKTFEFAVQVRDRMLEGYQEIMRMQV